MLSLADVLARTTKILGDHFSLIAGYIGWLLLPLTGVIFLQLLPQSVFVDVVSFILGVVSLLLSVQLTIILGRLIYGLSYGIKIPHELLTQNSRQLFLSVFITVFLQSILIGGLIPLIIPGLLALVWIGFAHLSVILDGKRPFEAIFHSYSLSRGRFFAVAWRLLGGFVVWIGLYACILLVILTSVALSTNSWELLETSDLPTWFLTLDMAGRLFFLSPILFIHTVLVYHALQAPEQEPISIVSPPIKTS